MVNEATMAIVARPGLPAANLAEFAPGVRREGRRLNLGNAGVGSTNHLCRLLLASAIGGPMTLVLCRGNVPVMNDLVAGGLAMGCDQTTNNAEQIRAGAIRVYPVSTPARGLAPRRADSRRGRSPRMRMSGRNMLSAPAGRLADTPPAPTKRMNRALLAALRDGERRAAVGRTREHARQRRADHAPAAQAFWRTEVARWKPLPEAAGQFAG